MGALTSKPYSFAARPWELTSIMVPNYSEPFASTIKFDLRGNNIMRVLPVSGQYKINDWISDYTRFSYDGFVRQRLETPFIMDQNELKKSDWSNVKLAFDRLIPEICESPLGLIGQSLTIDEIKYFDKWIANKNGMIASTCSKNVDWRNSYLSKDLRDGKFEPLVLFIEFDPKMETPVLNAIFQQAAQFELVEFFSIGSTTWNQNYNIKTISNDVNVLKEIAIGSHVFCKELIKKGSIEIIVKSNISETLQTIINFFISGMNKQMIKINVNYISLFSGIVNFFELTRTNIHHNSLSTFFAPNWIYSAYSDEFDARNFKLIYQGSNGDKMAEKAIMILPSSSIIERDGSNLNSSGYKNRTNSLFAPLNTIRSFKNILELITRVIFMKYFKSMSFVKNVRFNDISSNAFEIGNMIIQQNDMKFIEQIPKSERSMNVIRRYMTSSLYRDSITRSSRYIAIAIKRFNSDLITFNTNILY